MRRRDFIAGSLSLLAAPLPGFASTTRTYSARAIDLVAQSNVIDMLGFLTLDWKQLERWRQTPEAFTRDDFQKLKSSGISVFHPAVALESKTAYEETLVWFEKWNRFIAAYPDYFIRVDNAGDLARAKRDRRIGIMIGMQDANHLRNVDDVDAFYRMGQRLTQLTYNSGNLLGSGCRANRDQGITHFGQDAITRMNRLGMAIDVSHCGQRTTLDAIAASDKPVLITHSNCLALAPGVARCKSDEVITASARRGGVMGITSVRHFVSVKTSVSVEDVLDHFDYAVKLTGIEHVGLGSDFDLDAHPTYDISGLNDCGRIYELTDGLIRRGYTNEHISLILGGNFERALQEIRVSPASPGENL